MSYKTFHIKLFIISFLFLVGCGRKQRDLFLFETEAKVKINKLDLPGIRGLTATKKHTGHDHDVIQITWFNIFNQKNSDSVKALQKNFIGYDVFKLTKHNFIPKHPLNQSPLTVTEFVDQIKKTTNKSHKTFYLVQPVFKFDDQFIKGPCSNIVGIEE